MNFLSLYKRLRNGFFLSFFFLLFESANKLYWFAVILFFGRSTTVGLKNLPRSRNNLTGNPRKEKSLSGTIIAFFRFLIPKFNLFVKSKSQFHSEILLTVKEPF